MLLSLGVWLALFCIGLVDCLTCLHCTDTQNPRHCKHVTECAKEEVCRIHQKTTKYGEVLFDLGCAAVSTCSNRSQGIHSCDECCSTNLCNSAGCGKPGYPSNRGPICYSCSDQSTEESSCHSIDFCGSDEVCMISEEREFGDIIYTSQCVESTHCETLKKEVAPIIGRSILEAIRSVTEMTCRKCCHGDLCNANCSTNVNFCASNPCVHGRCVNGMTGYTCVCDPMYNGRNCSVPKILKDCLALRDLTHVSGVYTIQIEGSQQFVEVYCDMETDGGGWTVFQRRVNGSVDFYQNFLTYENGFGDVHGEFWLGLKNIYDMTSNASTELRIDLMAANGSMVYEVFPNFRLSKAANYTLHIDKGHGTAGDSFSWHSGQGFHTYDHDDEDACARQCHGGWWYRACALVSLNGQYVTPGTYALPSKAGIIYFEFEGDVSMKESKMMFRRV